MTKVPRLGVGKSRLAAEIGRVEAWRINRALQARTLRTAHDSRWMTLLCVTPAREVNIGLPHVWPISIARIAQSKGDLGERMAHAFGARRHVAMIGTDCPGLRRRHIASGFEALKRAPFALGPAEDGGFWLIAARFGVLAARAMAGVRWSTEYAARDVLERLGRENVVLLETLRDVDTAADLRS